MNRARYGAAVVHGLDTSLLSDESGRLNIDSLSSRAIHDTMSEADPIRTADNQGRDSVELRAAKDSNSLVVQLSRATAELELRRLAAEGWSVRLVELDAAADNGDASINAR